MALDWLRRSAWAHLVAGDAAQLCVAGVALGHGGALGRAWSPVTPPNFAWQAWHLVTSTFVSRGRRGTWSHPPSFCMASVALVALGWLRWRAWARLGALGRRWRRPTLRGRRGTWWHPPSFCVAGVALGHIHLRFAWQAWHLWHWAGSGGALGHAWARLVAGDAA